MIILDPDKSNDLRQKYVDTFIDRNIDLYVERILRLIEFSDGLCYTGYLWDCFQSPNVIPEIEIMQKLKGKKNVYIMWDIHSVDNIHIPNYWKYPKNRVLFVDEWSEELRNDLPEDIYIFDDSFTWSAVYTHETDINEEPYCLFQSNRENID
ncbi:MAG: hypothetical protein J1E00_05830 [Oscillospiraceae bacterium]|nr:hypothetical protein [Oscillospiraceae bacterium]